MSWLGRFTGLIPVTFPVYRDIWVPPILPPRGPLPPWRIPVQRAAVAYVNGTTAAVTGTTVAISVPGGVSNGNLLILCVSHAGSTNFAVTGGGWGQLLSDNAMNLWYRVANSEPASYTLTWTTSGAVGMTMTAWSGQDADPFLAYRITTTSATTTPHPTSALYFQACDHMVVQFAKHATVAGLAVPSGGYTAGPISGGTVNRVAYKSATNTAGVPANSWTDPGGGHSFGSITVAIRQSGSTALSLKSFALTTATANVASFACNLPAGYAAGDLLVVHHAVRDLNPATARTLSASGYAVVGSQLNWTSGTQIVASVIYKRVATGSDALTCAVSVSSDSAKAYVLAFSTGSAGDDPTVLGTPGQAVDTGSDTTHNVPAMTLDDYAEDNIVCIALSINAGGATNLTAPAGFDAIARNVAGGGSDNSGQVAVMLNSAANPGATSCTSTGSTGIAHAHQFAVGVALEGAGQTEVSSYLFG